MDKITYIVKWLSLSQAALIIFLIVLLYLSRIFFVYTQKWNQTQKQLTEQQLNSDLEQTQTLILTSKQIKWLQRHIKDVLLFLNKLEKKLTNPIRLAQFKQDLSNQILQPAARKLARSRRWYKRYIATQCFAYGFAEQDQALLQQLITDDYVLVSVNATKIAVAHANPLLINTMISFYSHGRRLQQSVFANLLAKDHSNLLKIIEQRLQTETDIYVRIYCYHLLQNIAAQQPILAKAKEDLLSHSADLKIAILHYVATTEDPEKEELIYRAAQDSAWEVRAIAAKLLGDIHTAQSLQLTEKLLGDSQWWVRINAANSLGKQGEKGLQILQQQTAEQDKFAYEAATQILTQFTH